MEEQRRFGIADQFSNLARELAVGNAHTLHCRCHQNLLPAQPRTGLDRFIAATPACEHIATVGDVTRIGDKIIVRGFRDRFAGRRLRYICNPRCFKSNGELSGPMR
jgi:hypothetical protein